MQKIKPRLVTVSDVVVTYLYVWDANTLKPFCKALNRHVAKIKYLS